MEDGIIEILETEEVEYNSPSCRVQILPSTQKSLSLGKLQLAEKKRNTPPKRSYASQL